MSNSDPAMRYAVALFHSIHGVLAAQAALLKAELPHRVIATPRHLSSNCGFCIRYDVQQEPEILQAIDSERFGFDKRVLF